MSDVKLNTKPNIPTLATLLNDLTSVSHKWHKICIQLGIPNSKLRQFEKDGDPLIDSLDYWLNGNTEVPITWGSVVAALESPSVGELGLAKVLREKYRMEATDKATKQTIEKNDEESSSTPETKEKFPYLQIEDLTEEQKDKLMKRLVFESDRIKTKFAVLVGRTSISLGRNNVSVGHLKLTFTSLGLDELVEKLHDESDLNEALMKASKYWSFFDYETVTSIINTYCKNDADLQEEVESYISSFKIYCQRRLCEVPIDNFETEIHKKTTKLYVKMDENFTISLNEVKRIEAKVSGLLDTDLYLLTVKEGCIELIFSCLRKINLLFPLNSQQEEDLLKMGVLRLYDDICDYYPVPSQDKSPSLSLPPSAESPPLSLLSSQLSAVKQLSSVDDSMLPLEMSKLSLELNDSTTTDLSKENQPDVETMEDEYYKDADDLMNESIYSDYLSDVITQWHYDNKSDQPSQASFIEDPPILFPSESPSASQVEKGYGVFAGSAHDSGSIRMSIASAGSCAALYSRRRSRSRSLASQDNEFRSRSLTFSKEFVKKDLNDPRLKMIDAADTTTNFSLEIHHAARAGNLEEVKCLIAKGHNPMWKNNDNDTALHVAAFYGRLEVLKYLTEEEECNPASLGQNETTPLHSAAEAKHLSIVEYLIQKHQVDPLLQDKDGYSPLHRACISGELAIVRFLIETMLDYMKNEDIMRDVTKDRLAPIHLAALKGHLHIVKYFISDMKCSPIIPGGVYSRGPMFYAAQNGHLSIVKSLITEYGCDPASGDSRQTTPLHLAAQNGHLAVVNYLVQVMKCDPLCRDSDENTPLHYAAFGGHIKILEFYFSVLKCSPNVTGHFGRVPLHHASEGGHLNVVKYLIEDLHCDPSILDDKNVTPLHLAALGGHLSIIHYLTQDKGCDPASQSDEQYTPLHFAAQNGHLPVVDYLVQVMKCDPLCRDSDENTPLHYAAFGGHIKILEFYFSVLKCSPNVTGHCGKVPLHLASRGGHLNVVKYLIEDLHCDPSILDDNNVTPLHLAAMKGHLSIVGYLTQDKGCDPASQTNAQRTPLHFAAKYGHLPLVDYLVQIMKCDPLCRDSDENTPLHYAAFGGHIKILEFYFSVLKCSPNVTGQYGRMPLHHASGGGHLNVVKYLIENLHCDPSILDDNNVTPLHLAALGEHLSTVHYLTQD